MMKRLLVCMTLLCSALMPAYAEVTLGVSLASDANPFYIAMRKGIEQRVQELGWKVRFVTANEDPAAQINGVQDLVTQQVDGILISAIDSIASNPAYRAAAQADIPIISVARGVNTPHQTMFVAMDERQVGRDIGDWAAKAIGRQGEIALMPGPPGSAVYRNMVDGFLEALSDYPDVQVVFRKEAALQREEGLRIMQDILIGHPDVKLVYAGNDEIALGAVQAIAAAGRKGQILVTGMNGIPPAIAAVRRGDLALTVELNPLDWGRAGVDAMDGWLKGQRGSQRAYISHKLIDASNVPR